MIVSRVFDGVKIYTKLEHPSSSSKYVYEAISKIDSRLKHHFWSFLAKEINKISNRILKEQCGDLDAVSLLMLWLCVGVEWLAIQLVGLYNCLKYLLD